MFRIAALSATLSLALSAALPAPAQAQGYIAINHACDVYFKAIANQAAKGVYTIIPITRDADDDFVISSDITGGKTLKVPFPEDARPEINTKRMDTTLVIWSSQGSMHPIRFVFISYNQQNNTCTQNPKVGKMPLFNDLKKIPREILIEIKLSHNKYRTDNTATYYFSGDMPLSRDEYNAVTILTDDDLRRFIRDFSY